MEEQRYAGVSDRIKAVVTDGVVIIIFIIAITYIFDFFENVPNYAKMIAFAFIFGFYDPLFTTFFGGTIGHLTNGICVKRDKDHNENILFHSAFIRFILKALLGWISLLTISRNEKGKAIHDIVAGSVVVFKDTNLGKT